MTRDRVQIDRSVSVLDTATPSPPPPPRSCPPAEGAQRRLLPDDSIEITYTDGTVKVIHPDGRIVTTFPDGTSYEEKPWHTISQVPYATPPEPPDAESPLAVWLGQHNLSLLNALQTVLADEADGPASLDRYLEKEREQGIGLYEQIASRTVLLERLLKN